jgi:pimeloyl-ACP methyl ester carboxylesterase
MALREARARFLGVIAAATLAALALAAPVAAQSPDPTLYCQGDGGPLGMATDLEHTVLLGEAPLPAGVSSSIVSVGGASTRVLQSGPASAREAVVLVHGNPGSARDWDDLLAANGRFARTVSFDVSGYGKSDKGAAAVQSTDGVASYIQGLLDQLGIKRAVLVLHDFGGIWGLQWASKHPDALTGVVPIDTGILMDYIPHPLAVIWSTPIAGELQLAGTTRDSFRQNIQLGQQKPLPADYVDRAYDNYDRATRCALLRYYRSAAAETSGKFDQNGIARPQSEALKRRSRPALVIWGEHDPYLPVSYAERQKETFPAAQVHVFSDAAHWPFVDDPDRTRGLVVPFLRPKLSASRPRARAGARRLRVPVRVEGMLPAYSVTATLEGAGASTPRTISGARTVSIRLRRALRPGRYRLRVTALGLPARRLTIRVAAPATPRSSAGAPQFTAERPARDYPKHVRILIQR